MMKIVIFGIGYVGLSNALLLAEGNEITMVDIDLPKIEKSNKKQFPLDEDGINEALQNECINIKAIHFDEATFSDIDIVIIAIPTNYSKELGEFNTQSIEQIIRKVGTSESLPLIE